MVSKKALNTFLASAVIASAGAATTANVAQAAEKEKCYGVVKAGHNDCANASKTHSCAGHATVGGSGEEWVAMPKGLCEKLVGGSTEPYEGTSKDSDGDSHDHG